MKELVPTPVEPLEDMVTLVAVMVKSGVAGCAGEPETRVLNAKTNPRATSRRFLCMAETFPRVACTLPAWLDEVQLKQLADFAKVLRLIARVTAAIPE